MTLAAPLALALLALVVPLVWVFLARQRARRQVVGSTLLLRRAASRAAARSPIPRLRHPIAFLLTMLALLTLILGVVGPRCGDAPRGRWIVVVDAPAELSWPDPSGNTPWRDAVAGLPAILASPGLAEVALVRAGPVPTTLTGATGDAASVIAWANQVVPGGRSDPDGALALAEALCRDPEQDGILWVGAPPPAGLRCPIWALSASPRPPGVELAGLVANRTERLGELELWIASADTSGAPAEVVVEVRVDDQLVEVLPLRTTANGVAWTRRTLPVDGERVEVRRGDGPPGFRDVLVAVSAPAAPTHVVWWAPEATRKTSFFRTALELHPRVRLSIATDLSATDPIDLLIVEGDTEIPDGPSHVLVFGPEAARRVGVTTLDVLEDPKVTRWDFANPLLRHLELDPLTIQRATALVPPPGGRVLVEAAGRPIMVQFSRGPQQVSVAGFLPGDTDLPLRVDFLHLVANYVDAASPNPAARPAPEVGRPWTGAAVDETLWRGEVELSRTEPVPVEGALTIRGPAGDTRGQVSARVSPSTERTAVEAPQAPAGGVQGLPWWVWAAIVAGGLLVAETALGAALRTRTT